ncbi:MAG: hypothetical protein JSS07_09825 [Proteobacteria bacterium]|nr:hypothetical protein [Pseudomonadota bacterium]
MVHTLDTFLNPPSIAVIVAREKLNLVGMKIFKNPIDEGYSHAIYPVNAEHKTLLDKTAFSSVGGVDMGFSIKLDIDKNLIIAEKKIYE